MKYKPIVLAAFVLSCLAPAARATQRFPLETRIYELNGVNLVASGTVQPFFVLRSKSVEVEDILRSAFPGIPLELRTFPLLDIGVGEALHVKWGTLGTGVLTFTDGLVGQARLELTLDDISYPPLTAYCSPGGGSVFLLMGGKEKTFIACFDFDSGDGQRTDDIGKPR
jgi:hypothetical protein